MRFINIAPILALAVSIANAESIYIDRSCSTRDGWDQIWAEVMQMAESTRDLFRSPSRDNYADFEYLVAQIFKLELDGKSRHGYLYNVVNEIAEMSVSDNYKTLLIRIFCDSGKVMGSAPATFAPSQDGRLELVGNKWYDYVNQMYRDDHPCNDDRGAITEGGKTGGVNNDQYWDAWQRGHNPDRIVITVCDTTWQRQRKPFGKADNGTPLHITTPQKMLDPIKYVEDNSKEFNYEDAPLDIFFPLPSRAIFHELVHAVTNNVIEDAEGRNSYGWRNVLKMDPANGVKNADSYALLAQFVLVQDLLGLTLQRMQLADRYTDDRQTTREEQDEAREILASWVAQGRIRRYDSIKKKPLNI